MKKLIHTTFLTLLLLGTTLALTSCQEKKEEPPKGEILVNTTPEGAEVIYGSKVIGVTPKVITATPKFYTVRLSKEGYKDKFVSFDVKANADNPAVSATLEPIKAVVLIESTPSGANVIYKDMDLGLTPLVIKDLSYGEHTIVLQKSGFSKQPENIKITNERPRKIQSQLVSDLGIVEITSEPEGAEIYLKDKLIGVTPFKTEFADGEYNITIKKNQYHDLNAKLFIERNKTKKLNYALNLLSSRLQVTSSIKGAEVYLNGELAGKTPLSLDKLAANQEYNVEIKLKNYIADAQKVTLVAGNSHEMTFNLKRNVGDAELVINPPGVTVYIDGKKHSVTEADESPNISKIITLKDLEPGKHTLKIYHKRAVPDSKSTTFDILPDEVIRVKDLSLWVPNAEIIMKDGSTEVGIIVSEHPDFIYFESSAGTRFGIRHRNIQTINRFKDSE